MSTQSLASALQTPRLSLTDQVSSLDRHRRQCDAARSLMFGAAAWAELAHGVVAPRFVTTVSLAVVLLAVCCAWF